MPPVFSKEAVKNPNDYLYRVQNIGPSIHFDVFKVLKRTAKGMWIVPEGVRTDPSEMFYDATQVKHSKRWVKPDGTFGFVQRTPALALRAFRIRKCNEIKHLERRMRNVQDALNRLPAFTHGLKKAEEWTKERVANDVRNILLNPNNEKIPA